MTGALFFPVLAASLMGSLHCAAMCGPFAAFYAGNDRSRGLRRALPHVFYHSGRLTAYVALGALAGSLGHAVDLAGGAAGIGRVAGVVAGLSMMLWAIALLAEHVGLLRLSIATPRPAQAFAANMLTRLRDRPPLARAGLLGLATTLLPCGWLYAFAVIAAGTGHALDGAVVMGAFFAGTVPLLLGVGLGFGMLGTRFRRHVPVISAIALLAVGLTAIAGRVQVLPTTDAPACHAKGPTP